MSEITFTKGLGGGKERSVTYETTFCMTAEEIDACLNKDKYAYSYIYWNAVEKGVFITLCKPNPKSFEQRSKPRVEQGLEVLTESQAIDKIQTMFSALTDICTMYDNISMIIGRLYDNGFKVSKPIDRQVTEESDFSGNEVE